MKFSLNWLKEHVKITITPEELAHKLTMAGFEVEGIDYIGEGITHIVTGKILSIIKHPDADKLVITQIDVGQDAPVQIVTGANNIAEGDVVPVSLPGAVLADGTKIKEGKLRGEISNGMLCSEVELGVADESAGIWILPKETVVGEDFVSQLQDVVIDVAILPNRGDCQSINGLLRELRAIL